jgi:hypothetical protein
MVTALDTIIIIIAAMLAINVSVLVVMWRRGPRDPETEMQDIEEEAAHWRRYRSLKNDEDAS